MSVQTKYGFATSKGIAGGIYDMYHYPVDSRYNEEDNGVLRFGMGVVRGSLPGSNVALPTSASKAADFEGVIVNGFSNQHDLEGVVSILNNQNIGVMRKGRIWVALAEDAEPKYGDAVHLIVDGDEAGCFDTTGGVAIAGRFIGGPSNGVAPVELYGVDAAAFSGSGTTEVALSDLTDVDLTVPATEGQVLKYNASESKWKPGNDATGA